MSIHHHTGVLRPLGAALIAIALVAPAPAEAQRKRAKADVAAEVERLQGADVKVATEAATRLGKDGSRPAVDALLDALAMGVHPRVAAAALEGLAPARDARAFDTLAYYQHHRDARVRAAAVRAIGGLEDRRANGFVLAALRDHDKGVRAVAAELVKERDLKQGIEPLLALLKKGDEAVAPVLGAMADPDLARVVGELIGRAPDDLVARALGLALQRKSFGPETARVEVVRALGKVPGSEAVEQLTNYVESIPENPPRQSRREAEAIVEHRLTGDL